MKDVKIWLGYEEFDHSRSLDNWNNKIYWCPQKELNQHLLISGSSGSGKTETLKVICSELNKHKIPILIFDFHNDFTDFADNIVNEDSIKIHPLQILPGEKPKDVKYKVSSILKHSFQKITEIQEGVIRQAIEEFYRDCGITNMSKKVSRSPKLKPFYTFKSYFGRVSTDSRTVSSIEIKLDILFDYELFSHAGESSINFDELLKKNTVFQLKQAPSDDVKKIVAELMISKLIQYSYNLEQTKDNKIRLYCIIDEAHRMVYPGSPLDTLFREARKYGIGVILASQRSTDFKEVLLSNAGTIITFKQNLLKDARYIAKNKWGREDVLMRARAGQGFVRFSSDQVAKCIQIVPTKRR